jgi:hypothetical protein
VLQRRNIRPRRDPAQLRGVAISPDFTKVRPCAKAHLRISSGSEASPIGNPFAIPRPALIPKTPGPEATVSQDCKGNGRASKSVSLFERARKEVASVGC